MFRLFIIMIIVLLLLIIFLDVIKLKQFTIIKKIKNKKLQWLLALIPIVIISLIFNYVNAFVIFIHLAIFFYISQFIVYLIKKIFKKEFKFYLTGILAIIFTITYLGIAAYIAYNVVETKYTITTNKDIDNFRIILLSDSHVGTTFDGDGFYKHMENISKIDSDILVVIGDFVDDDTKKEDMIKSCKALALAKPTYGVYFVYGNHDKGYFNKRSFTAQDLKNELEKNNIKILEDEIIDLNNKNITIIGRKDKSDKTRKDIKDLVKDIDKNKYIISLNHQPNDYDNEMNNVDLVLSGHSHGGQMFPLAYIGLITKANDEFYGLHTRGNTNFIVTSGISDWAADFKTGAKAEYVVIDIKKAN